jgi:hypothetical protein
VPKLNLTHFEASFLFALFTSLVLGVVSRNTDPERLRYGLKSMAYFMLALVGLGWLMYFGHG